MTLRPSARETENSIETIGMVLKTSPVGEADRRVVLLTRELGKISAFARGARRSRSQLTGQTAVFSFGSFRFYRGRDSYVLTEANIDHYFDSLSADVESACYGSYFMEVLDDLTREGSDGSLPLLLGYYSLRALEKGAVPKPLVKAVFELRLIMQEGVFRGLPDDTKVHPAMRRAVSYIEQEPLSKLFSFTLEEEPLLELTHFADTERNRFFQHSFTSLTILDALNR